MTLSSGCSTSHTSLTPSAHTCGSLAARPRPFERGAGEVAPAALGEHGRLGGDVGARLEVALLAALLVAPLVAGAHADDGAVLDDQLRADRLGEEVGARLLGLLAQPAVELGDRDHVVAVVAERRRDRHERDRPLLVRHEVDALALRPRRSAATSRRPGTARGSRTGSSPRPRAGARRRPCPSRARPPAPRRATPSARGRPRAAAAAGSRTRARPGRRRRSRRRPRSARPRRRSAAR